MNSPFAKMNPPEYFSTKALQNQGELRRDYFSLCFRSNPKNEQTNNVCTEEKLAYSSLTMAPKTNEYGKSIAGLNAFFSFCIFLCRVDGGDAAFLSLIIPQNRGEGKRK